MSHSKTPFAYGDTGLHVLELQERLLLHRYELTGYDGQTLGEETWRALARLGDDCGILLPWAAAGRPIPVPQELIDILWSDPDPEIAPAVHEDCSDVDCSAGPGYLLFDMSRERVAVAPKVRVRGGKVVETPPKKGIMIHQTAVDFGVSAGQLRDAKGDRAKALARRALNVAAHVTIFPAHEEHPHVVALAAPLAWHVNHGNDPNAETIGFELAGRWEGLKGNPRTLWGGGNPTPITELDVRAWQQGIEEIVLKARAVGHPIEYVCSHRQSSNTRRSDPGEAPWNAVAPWLVTHLGLRIETRVWGTGRPLPAQWSGGKGLY